VLTITAALVAVASAIVVSSTTSSFSCAFHHALSMDVNPLFDADVSDAESSSASSIDGESYTIAIPHINTAHPTFAVLQTVNIKSHIPIVLDLTEPN
jgi:hypothetical protein